MGNGIIKKEIKLPLFVSLRFRYMGKLVHEGFQIDERRCSFCCLRLAQGYRIPILAKDGSNHRHGCGSTWSFFFRWCGPLLLRRFSNDTGQLSTNHPASTEKRKIHKSKGS